MKKKAFTIMELLIALAIMAIMAAIVVSVYRGYVKKAARSALQTDTRNCITCVSAELARIALTGGEPDFDNCTNRISRYTQSCSVTQLGEELYQCTCSGKGMISGSTCILNTESTSFEGSNCE
uniref:Prepilin-type N-terminal cleavage/methylation domain-containing protein n=1 Tax=Thermodesulfobacterium geofontis TaxID=1295609 RepID=A0A7V5XI20_9BACT